MQEEGKSRWCVARYGCAIDFFDKSKNDSKAESGDTKIGERKLTNKNGSQSYMEAIYDSTLML